MVGWKEGDRDGVNSGQNDPSSAMSLICPRGAYTSSLLAEAGRAQFHQLPLFRECRQICKSEFSSLNGTVLWAHDTQIQDMETGLKNDLGTM